MFHYIKLHHPEKSQLIGEPEVLFPMYFRNDQILEMQPIDDASHTLKVTLIVTDKGRYTVKETPEEIIEAIWGPENEAIAQQELLLEEFVKQKGGEAPEPPEMFSGPANSTRGLGI